MDSQRIAQTLEQEVKRNHTYFSTNTAREVVFFLLIMAREFLRVCRQWFTSYLR